MTRVVVDAWELLPAPHRRGIGRFLEGILPELADRVELVVLDVHGTATAELSPVVPHRWSAPHRLRSRRWEHLVRLPADLRSVPHDVAWCPGGPPPWRTPGPWVHTVHDLFPLDLDHPRYGDDRRRWQLLGWRLERADAVVTPSRFTAERVVDRLRVAPEKVQVVPHGIDDRFGPEGPRADLPPDTVLAFANDDPRKGHERIAALARSLAAVAPEATVAVVGPLTRQLTAAMRSAAHPAPLLFLGHVDDPAATIRGARVVVVCATHEGFGFTALEAMACGRPVVAFENTATAEVVGGAGTLVADGDSEAMATAVAALLHDGSGWEAAAVAGASHAAGFRWADAAARYGRILTVAASR